MAISDPGGVSSVRISEGSLPQKVGDAGYQSARGDGYGGQYVNPLNVYQRAMEGSLFVMRNATAGTGIAQTANTTSDTTKPFIMGVNPSTSGKVVVLHWLKLKPTAVSSGQTVQNIDIVTSVGLTRTSAGTDYSAKASNIATAGYQVSRGDTANSTVLTSLFVGVPVAVLGSAPRNPVRFQPRVATIPVVNDVYTAIFDPDHAFAPQTDHAIVASTTVDYFYEKFPPVLISPGEGFEIIPWAGSIAGAMSWEFELVWSER